MVAKKLVPGTDSLASAIHAGTSRLFFRQTYIVVHPTEQACKRPTPSSTMKKARAIIDKNLP